ncbi:malectin domain-containing carbohydrate-binding protein [Mucilaginibacter celer]|uniref:T9SS C-terminal target domain-containing protein n=1 Tax=Mucilaginibacter celer TaxID=2305508 RepID=A0A494VNE3_9SPHI|nr:malectin domain-containing carbohydrate-binding protein [Mucilaginibacter celer]AYL95251.1 T9SS C-terminal target domain-containing protein [Mucilaginibacter celer]
MKVLACLSKVYFFRLSMLLLLTGVVKNADAGNNTKYTSFPADTCSPVSTLPCQSLKVPLPFNLSFNSPASNTIADKNGAGTGFTTVNNYSANRLPADGTPTNPQVPGYEPSKITLSAGTLQIVSNKGIDYLTNNNQLNVLGVKIAGVNKLQIDVKIINPYNGTSSQQAGIWYGLNDKTFIKLDVNGNKVELRKELNDISSAASGNANPDQRVTAAITGLNTQTLRLRMVIDSVANTAEGFYSTDGTTYKSTGAAYSSPALNIAGMGLTDSDAFAGIYSSYRNGSAPVTFTFDDFAISSPAVVAQSSVNIDFLPSGSAVPTGYTGDTGLPYDAARKFGWVDPVSRQPTSLQANMRIRSGTGDAKLRSLVQMQANTNNQNIGAWEYAMPNGTYTVTVSTGDDGYYDSNHQVNIEGLPTVSDFIPSASQKYRSGTATVQVTDGKLTIDANGGANTKMNYILFAPAVETEDTIKPVTGARFAGTLKSAGVYSDQVQVFLTANDAGGSGLKTFQYALNNAAYTNYTAPFTISSAGNYSLNVKAADANGNRGTASYNFSISSQPASGAYMVLKNPDLFPADDNLVFSLIQTPWRRTSPDTTPYNANHDKIKLRINNKGTGKLNISGLTLTNTSAWKIAAIGNDTTAVLPVSVSAGAFTDVTIQFKAKDAATRVKIFNDTLKIVSTDSVSPLKKVMLHGIWQAAGESTNEPYAYQIIDAFGLTSSTGYAHDDGDNNGTTRVANSSEVDAAYFVRADPSRPVIVHQMAAYHGCCSAVEAFRYYSKGSSSVTTLFTHDNLDGQSVMPRLSNSILPAQGSFNPTGAFGIQIGSSNSDRTKNFNGLIGIRFLKVYDANGNIVPDAYILDCDYLGTSFTNYDYQDNLYYVENIRPDAGSVHHAELASIPNTTVNIAPVLTGSNTSVTVTLKNTGLTYPDGTNDGSIALRSAQITGPYATEFTVSALKTSSLAPQATTTVTVKFTPTSVGIKNAALLINYASAASPLRIPLYSIGNSSMSTVNVVKRIKGGSDVNLTIGNQVFEADKNYRKGSIKLDTQVVPTDIMASDIDSLYRTYLSAAADLAETRYEIPIANGTYSVRMHFVENYWTMAGPRIFSISIENQQVLPNFDIYKEVGYRAALVKDFTATVNDGVMNIKFNPTANRVALAGMEIFKIDTSAPALFSTAVINDLPQTEKRKIIVYPNPNSGSNFFVNATNFAKNEQVELHISNMAGKLLQSQRFVTDQNGSAGVLINLNNRLSRGIYIINTTALSGNLYSKLMVQ